MHDDRFDTLTRAVAGSRSRRQLLTGVGTALVAAVFGARLRPASAQGNSGAAAACQQGGYATLMRGTGPRQGEGFQTVGECVRYAAQGGTLVPLGGLGSFLCDYARSYILATQQPDLSSVDLHGCDLSGLNISGGNLGDATLLEANLSGADLTGAYLAGAILSDADLSYADLTGAYLAGANLQGANLQGANLEDADLGCADLTGANLADVFWRNTICPDNVNSDPGGGGTCIFDLDLC